MNQSVKPASVSSAATELDSTATSDGLTAVTAIISYKTQTAAIITRVTDQKDGRSLEVKTSRTGGNIATLMMMTIGRVSLRRNTLALTSK